MLLSKRMEALELIAPHLDRRFNLNRHLGITDDTIHLDAA